MKKRLIIILGLVIVVLIVAIVIFFIVNNKSDLDNNYYEQMTDNEKVKIELKGNASTGYKWEPTVQTPDIVKLVFDEYVLSESNSENENIIGTFKFLFDSIGTGTTDIIFNYTNGINVMYTLKYTIEVDNEMKLNVQEGEGTYPEINIPMPEIELSNG